LLSREAFQPVRKTAEAFAAMSAHLADGKKGEDIVVLEIKKLSSITDYFVIVTARNERQLKAIREELCDKMAELGAHLFSIEGDASSQWILIDFGDVVVHLFTSETRALYDLEMLWGDAPSLNWAQAQPLTVPEGS